jgi:hypothetical protein
MKTLPYDVELSSMKDSIAILILIELFDKLVVDAPHLLHQGSSEDLVQQCEYI